MARHVGDQKAAALFIHRQEFVEVAGHRRHGLVHRCNAQVPQLRSRRRQNRELQLAGNGEFVLNRLQASLVGVDHLQRGIPDGEKKDGEPHRVPGTVVVVTKRPREIRGERFDRKYDAAHGKYAAVGQHEVFAGQTRHKDDRQQDSQGTSGEQIVEGYQLVRRSGEDEVSETSHGDGQACEDHCLHNQPVFAEAQLHPGHARDHHSQVRETRPDIGSGHLQPVRQCSYGGGLPASRRTP